MAGGRGGGERVALVKMGGGGGGGDSRGGICDLTLSTRSRVKSGRDLIQ